MSTEITETTPLNIFVTDGSSGLGQAVVKTLVTAGHKVFASTTDTSGAHAIRDAGGLPTFADLSRGGEIRANLKGFQIDVVVNVAPQVGNQIPLVNNVWSIDQVVLETKAMLEAAKDAGVKFFVHTSYAYAYGEQEGKVTEATKPNRGDSDVIKGALALDKAVLASGVPATILRLGYIYGAEASGVKTLSKNLLAGIPVMSTPAVTNWIHVEDAAEAVRRVVEAKPAGEVFNVVDGHAASSESFLKDFCAAFGLQPPNRVLDFLARGRINKAQLHLMKLSTDCSNEKIASTLGWSPVYKTQLSGIERLLLTWRAREAGTSDSNTREIVAKS